MEYQKSFAPACLAAAAQVVGLFPFLSVDFTSAKQRLLRAVSGWHEQVALLGAALGRLPQRLQTYFVRSLGGAPAGGVLVEPARILPTR